MAKTITKETETTVVTVTLDKTLVNRFDKAYTKAGDSMALMCKLAYQITGDDKDARKLFFSHVVNDLGMSQGTSSKLISVGKIYNEHAEFEILSHTKCAELIPVSNDIDSFMTATGKTADDLNGLTQKALRTLVKNYLHPVDVIDVTDEETDETADDATGETTADNDVVNKCEVKTVDDNMTILYALCDAKNILQAILDNYDIEDEDLTIAKATIEELTKVAKDISEKGAK